MLLSSPSTKCKPGARAQEIHDVPESAKSRTEQKAASKDDVMAELAKKADAEAQTHAEAS